MSMALRVRGLTKTYADGHRALRGVDLDVERGDFFALLGPNGAGKTTLIGITSSLVNKTSGKVYIFDKDIDT
ncbi:MAG TPA: ATP-binding cassette domain-containing protein, partial [Chromatiales bacterium]|nr:ATP-binding cassette domain-containing protein [Chromatiales bacterium]